MLTSSIQGSLRRSRLSHAISTHGLRFLSSNSTATTTTSQGDDLKSDINNPAVSTSTDDSITLREGDMSKQPSTNKTLTNEQILKIANIDLVSKKEIALMEREKKIMTVYAFGGLALSLFGMSLGATVFLSI